MDKHSSLFGSFIDYEEKMFYNISSCFRICKPTYELLTITFSAGGRYHERGCNGLGQILEVKVPLVLDWILHFLMNFNKPNLKHLYDNGNKGYKVNHLNLSFLERKNMTL